MLRACTVAVAAVAACGAWAAEPVDLLFNTPHLRDAAPGSTLSYEHTRVSDPGLGIGPDFDRAIALEVGEGVATRFVMDAGAAPRAYPVEDGVPGNPLLMVMLENTLRAVAQATGGSPFYLRNRMREALDDGWQVLEPDHRFALRPFALDKNRARLGPFADLELRFDVAQDAPGMLVAMSAEAGPPDRPIYREEIRLDPTR